VAPFRALDDVKRRIVAACERSDRDPSSVRLVAVSKKFDAQIVKQAVAAGQTLFGENRVQEALDKIPQVGPGVQWHLIGHLQRNKARHVVGRFELIHGVDGIPLAVELNRRTESVGGRQSILLQVNLSSESTKSGVDEAALPELIEAVVELPALELHGLMTIPPPVERPEESRVWFSRMRLLRDEAEQKHGLSLPELSMGMTGDFEVAVEEGATLVRVGRAIFGERL